AVRTAREFNLGLEAAGEIAREPVELAIALRVEHEVELHIDRSAAHRERQLGRLGQFLFGLLRLAGIESAGEGARHASQRSHRTYRTYRPRRTHGAEGSFITRR